jgi:AmiR/NasT family two-component response regulator
MAHTTFSDIDTLFNTLDAAVVRNRPDEHIANARFVLIGFADREAVSLSAMLREAGAKSCASSKDVAKLREAADMGEAFSHIVVNLDAFDDMDDAVSALLFFRMRQKEVVVILISDTVKQDDLFQERKWICDATIKAPLSMKRLSDGLLAAWANNKEFNC